MSASPLPNGRVQFVDQNGAPLVGGLVYFYVPGTSAPKRTWADAAMDAVNPNPIVLDSIGSAAIWGLGSYRQVVQDQTGAVVWDVVTTVISYANAAADALNSAVNTVLEQVGEVVGLAGSGLTNRYTAAGGETTITVSQPVPMAWLVRLKRNGVVQDPTLDYTVNGSAIVTLTTPAAEGETFAWTHDGGFSGVSIATAPDGLIVSGGVLQAESGISVTGAPAGSTQGILVNNAQIVDTFTGQGNDNPALQIERYANYNNGSYAYVNNAAAFGTTVTGTSSNFEWCVAARLENGSTGNNEQVGVQITVEKTVVGASDTWGMQISAAENIANNDPASSLIGIEIGLQANGTDANFQRIGLDIVSDQKPGQPSGSTGVFGYGIRVFNYTQLSKYTYGLSIGSHDGTANFDYGLLMNAADTQVGIQALGTYAASIIDCHAAAVPVAIQMGSLQKLSWAGGNMSIYADDTAGKFYFTNGAGANIASLDVSGNLRVLGTITPSAGTL